MVIMAMMIISDEVPSYDKRNQEKRASEPLSIDQVEVRDWLETIPRLFSQFSNKRKDALFETLNLSYRSRLS